MSQFLPREWGESGALRVSDVNARPVPSRFSRREAQQWLREEAARQIVDIAAQELRQKNLKKAATNRHVRQSRVS